MLGSYYNAHSLRDKIVAVYFNCDCGVCELRITNYQSQQISNANSGITSVK